MREGGADAMPATQASPQKPARGVFLRWFALWAALFATALAAFAAATVPRFDSDLEVPSDLDVEIFVQPGCRHCRDAQRFLARLREERPGLVVAVRDVARDRRALARLRILADRARVRVVATPTLFVHGLLIVGWRDEASTGERVRVALARPRPPHDEAPLGETEEGRCPVEWGVEQADPKPAPAADPVGAARDCATDPVDDVVDLPLFGRVNARELGLPLFTVVLGLVDGFNPCAMWVLLFLLSLLVNLGSRSKMFLIAGTFMIVSGLCYFAFMAAWVTLFDVVGRARVAQLALGALAVFAGAVHVKDFVALGRGVTLSIPESQKAGIAARAGAILRANRLAGAMLGVVALAFLVNTVELLCTAGLPAVYASVLASHDLSAADRFGYLALYQVFYLLDDSAMLVIAIVTLSKRRLHERGGRVLKLVSGAVVGGLGLVLLFRPEWLYW
jgi:hypothetical protein